MTRETSLQQVGEPSSIFPLDSADDDALKFRILELSERIADLADGQQGKIEDIGHAQEIAQGIKPYVDRLVALKRLLNPVDRIIETRERIHALQAAIRDDVAEVENLSDDMGDAVQPSLLNQLEGEIASVKRDRKLFVNEIDAEEQDSLTQRPSGPSGRTLLDLSMPERFARLLGDRFISLPRLAEISGTDFSDEFITTYDSLLGKVWESILETEELRPHVQHNRIKSLQKAFSDYALLFRSPQLSAGQPCTLETLRRHFHAFFVNVNERGLWYTRFDFYRRSFDRPHWALVDRQYLNCTFKKPSIRLLMYARANGLPPRMVRQKSILEEVYDRIVLQLNLKDPFFDNCNSITSTTYQQGKNSPLKQVYAYYKDDSIRISGKRGIPHWRPTRSRWPGVMPTVIFSS